MSKKEVLSYIKRGFHPNVILHPELSEEFKEFIDWYDPKSYDLINSIPDLLEGVGNGSHVHAKLLSYNLEEFLRRKGSSLEYFVLEIIQHAPCLLGMIEEVLPKVQTNIFTKRPVLFNLKGTASFFNSMFSYNETLFHNSIPGKRDILNRTHILTSFRRFFDEDHFDWFHHSDSIIKLFPEFFNPDKFNWKAASSALISYRPEFFDEKRFDWSSASIDLLRHGKHLFNPDLYDWEFSGWYLVKYHPDLAHFAKSRGLSEYSQSVLNQE